MMVAVQVTVEISVDNLPDDAAREVARALVEGRGLNVARVAIKAQPDRVKPFIPKAGKPGSVVVRDGRAFSVWAEAPSKDSLWLVPVERQDGDAPVYLSHRGGRPYAHHSDGSRCDPTWRYDNGGERTETPCQHQSHKRAA